MAKVKAWVKENRIFMNAYDKGCDAVLYWRVEVLASYKDPDKAQWAAEFATPSHGGNLWATRKAELRPMRTIQVEINKFNDAVEEAQRRVEEHNAKS
jgi:hypothetical protein